MNTIYISFAYPMINSHTCDRPFSVAEEATTEPAPTLSAMGKSFMIGMQSYKLLILPLNL
jgi:hypothetical protein